MYSEIPQPKQGRIDFSQIRLKLQESGRTTEQIQRCRFATDVVNVALDLLDYKGTRTPYMVFSSDLVINGDPNISGFLPNGVSGVTSEPTILVDIGKEPANKIFATKNYVGNEPAQVIPVKASFNRPFERSTHVFEIIKSMLEEACHFVQYAKGEIPKDGLLKPGDPKYISQRHEKEALEFVDNNALAIAGRFQHCIEFY